MTHGQTTMKLFNHPLFAADLDRALAAAGLEPLYGRSILVTGASGLIGSAVVHMLLRCNETRQAGIRIYAASRAPEKLRALFPAADELCCVAYDAQKPLDFAFSVDYILHAASNATPDAYMRDPVGTMTGNFLGLNELLRWGLATGVRRSIYISSSEVYGRKESSAAYTETEYGYVDVLSVRSSYPMSKRASETLCACYASQFGAHVSIARPGHIYGPTATEKDGRVSSAFARMAARGEALVMKSAGAQLRSYCYCVDCASAILRILLCGGDGEAYNISNPDSILSIRQMAEHLANAGGVSLITELPTEAERAAFNPMDNSSLVSDKLEALGWRGLFGAEEGLRHTVQILRACR